MFCLVLRSHVGSKKSSGIHGFVQLMKLFVSLWGPLDQIWHQRFDKGSRRLRQTGKAHAQGDLPLQFAIVSRYVTWLTWLDIFNYFRLEWLKNLNSLQEQKELGELQTFQKLEEVVTSFKACVNRSWVTCNTRIPQGPDGAVGECGMGQIQNWRRFGPCFVSTFQLK